LNCPDLYDVRVFSKNDSAGAAAASAVAQMNNQLTHLSVFDWVPIQDASVVDVVRRCTCLKKLEITRASELTNAALTAISQHCLQLEQLSFTVATHLGDVGMLGLKRCSQLQYLDVPQSAVTDVGLIALITHCRRVTYINVEGCVGITDVSLTALPELSKGLTHLYLHGCKVKIAGVTEVLKGCRKLRFLQVAKRLENKVHDVLYDHNWRRRRPQISTTGLETSGTL
jgi:hypothetical protein